MSKIYLVRHGQASFGNKDYDALTDLGHQQAIWLGDYFRSRAVNFDRLFSGELNRQHQTCERIAGCLDADPQGIRRLRGLNEYSSEALYASFTGGGRAHEHQKRDRRTYWQTFRKAYESWVNGSLMTDHESWAAFCTNIDTALIKATKDSDKDDNILLTTSAGVIGAIVSRILDTRPQAAIELNFQVRNTSFCEILHTSKGLKLISFNSIPHLDFPERRDSITFV